MSDMDCSDFSPEIPMIYYGYRNSPNRPLYQQKYKNDENHANGIESFNWVLSYSDDIFNHWLSIERKRNLVNYPFEYIPHRPMLMTLIKDLIKLLKDNNGRLEFIQTKKITQHLTIHLLDTFLSDIRIPEHELRLLTMTCFIIATKMEEEESQVPSFFELNNNFLHSFVSLDTYRMYEARVLMCTKFDLTVPTVATFAEYFSRFSVILEDFYNYQPNFVDNSLTKNQKICVAFYSYEDMLKNVNALLFSLIDITVDNIYFLNINPSLRAAACVAAARILYNIKPVWTIFLELQTRYKEIQLLTIAKMIVAEHEVRLISLMSSTSFSSEEDLTDHTYSNRNCAQIISVDELPPYVRQS